MWHFACIYLGINGRPHSAGLLSVTSQIIWFSVNTATPVSWHPQCAHTFADRALRTRYFLCVGPSSWSSQSTDSSTGAPVGQAPQCRKGRLVLPALCSCTCSCKRKLLKETNNKKKNGLHPGFKLCSSISMETDWRALTFVWWRRRSFLRVSTIARELARLPEVVVNVACGVLSACHVILKKRKKSTAGTFHFP